jgi:RNA polymerase sigma-70 factor (ECF subfamily)
MTQDTGSDDRRLADDFLRTRSEAAFLRLYDRHSDALYRFAARLSGGPGVEPAELVQETWVRALTALPGFRWQSSLRTWLCGILLNRWRDIRAKRDRELRLSVVEGTRPLVVHEHAGERLALERALAQLPDGYREILLLHDLEGFTHEEIAARFGIVEGTSKSQLHRARRALREVLEGKRGVEHGG